MTVLPSSIRKITKKCSKCKSVGEIHSSDVRQKLKVIDEPVTSNAIILATGLNADNAEAYQLKVTQDNVTITGTSEAGTFYGIQTLRKSLPITNKGDISLPAAEINDYPRFSYRGVHLDVSRHFFPADSVKRFIDMMALHNINRLHWHLTDDQGWRIEIKKRPELTTIGSNARRQSSDIIPENMTAFPIVVFFTQDEAREIVKYAQERHITVIPEIDLPGHMQAALAAFPQNWVARAAPMKYGKMWGVSEDVLCAGNDKTLTFIEDVLNEIIDIFPSEYIHVGGDECPKVRWEKCPKCQARIKELGLKPIKITQPNKGFRVISLIMLNSFLTAGTSDHWLGRNTGRRTGTQCHCHVMERHRRRN